MKRLIITGLLFGFALAAQAQSTGTITVKDEVNQSVDQMPAAEADSTTAVGTDAFADSNCLRYTGSHLATANPRRVQADRKNNGCINAAGRAYTREDIERTGEVDLNRALQKLDPAIR